MRGIYDTLVQNVQTRQARQAFLPSFPLVENSCLRKVFPFHFLQSDHNLTTGQHCKISPFRTGFTKSQWNMNMLASNLQGLVYPIFSARETVRASMRVVSPPCHGERVFLSLR